MSGDNPITSCIPIPERASRQLRFDDGTILEASTRCAVCWPSVQSATGKPAIRMGWAVMGALDVRTECVRILAHSKFTLLHPSDRLPKDIDLTRIMLTWWRDYMPEVWYYAEDYETHRRYSQQLRQSNALHPVPSFWHVDMPDSEILDARMWQAAAEGRIKYPGDLYREIIAETPDNQPSAAKRAVQTLWTGFERNPWRGPR